jgi:hypothetical protein
LAFAAVEGCCDPDPDPDPDPVAFIAGAFRNDSDASPEADPIAFAAVEGCCDPDPDPDPDPVMFSSMRWGALG